MNYSTNNIKINKMRKLLTMLTVALTTLSTVSLAQFQNGKVNGTVIDGSAKTIESSTITLLRAKDSSVAKMSVADRTGKFAFESISEGQYLVSISAAGHNKGYSESFEISASNQSVSLKTL
jgi:hypothetical protein